MKKKKKKREPIASNGVYSLNNIEIYSTANSVIAVAADFVLSFLLFANN